MEEEDLLLIGSAEARALGAFGQHSPRRNGYLRAQHNNGKITLLATDEVYNVTIKHVKEPKSDSMTI